jgi:hypothetical protein
VLFSWSRFLLFSFCLVLSILCILLILANRFGLTATTITSITMNSAVSLMQWEYGLFHYTAGMVYNTIPFFF